MKRFFQPCVNVLCADYDFTTHRQKESETVAEYLCVLRAILVNCSIVSADEQHCALANQLVVSCCNKDTLQKLFVVGEPDFDCIYKIMEAEERATMDASCGAWRHCLQIRHSLFACSTVPQLCPHAKAY